MSVRIHLDNPHAFYTNLDFISGKIILSLRSSETVTSILVKLEGVSNTQLIRQQPAPAEDGKTQFAAESHKILYKVLQVFPAHEPGSATSTQSYTLPAGQHEYPFRFKFPINTTCATFTQAIAFGGIRLESPIHLQDKHITKTLPPSLSGFPMLAEIRYFVKVTVGRPSIWKGNRREQVGYKFLPIEPPRPPITNGETFARRPHVFQSGLAQFPKKQGMFSKKKSTPLSVTPPSVLVDARLPSSSILTCNEPVPLRLLVKKQASSPEHVFLVGLQIELVGFTHITAKELTRVEAGSWMVMTLSGLSRPVSLPTDPVGHEFVVDSQLWDHVPLPHTVTPSFETCNLRRTYNLDVRVTIAFGHPGDIQPQTQVLPLRFPVSVFSGIAPPAALLSAMAARNKAHAQPQPQSRPSQPPRPQSGAPASVQPEASDPLYPPQLGGPGAANFDDAPPSYEDAMADEIGPVDGPRRDWSGVTNEHAPSELGDDDRDKKSRKWFA